VTSRGRDAGDVRGVGDTLLACLDCCSAIAPTATKSADSGYRAQRQIEPSYRKLPIICDSKCDATVK
jgi:hypothetical protein